MIKIESDYKTFDYKVLHKNHSRSYKINKVSYRDDSVLIKQKYFLHVF